MKRRSRSRKRKTRRSGGTPRSLVFLFLLGAGVVLLATVFNSAAFSLVDLDRSGSIDVVSDPDGALSLDPVSEVNVGVQERLVTMTNRLNQSASVTVSIVSGSGTLHTGVQSGTSVSFSLSKAASRTVDIEAGGTGGDTIQYEIQASGTGANVTIPRSVETLETGEAAPGYPGSFNDVDHTAGQEEPGENNSIPPGNDTSGKMNNFPNMQVANDGASARLNAEGGSIDIGVATWEVPDVSDYEIRLRYSYHAWADDPTLNIVDESGNVLQSETLVHTDGVMDSVFIELNSAASSFVNSNGVMYATFTGEDVQLDVDYMRIQEDTPPPDAQFSSSCTVQDCSFDASSSNGFGKSLVSYTWDFGDGNTTTTSSSVIDHDYAANGTYNVKLTVENTAGETDTTSKLVSIGTLSPSLVPADVYDDVENWEDDPPAQHEDNSIPPAQTQGNKMSGDFTDVKQYDGNFVTFDGDPMHVGVGTLGISDEGSSYALELRHRQDTWEGTVTVRIVDADGNELQSQQLSKTGSFVNTTIQFNAAAESFVKNDGDVYVTYERTSGGHVSLDIDAHFVEITP